MKINKLLVLIAATATFDFTTFAQMGGWGWGNPVNSTPITIDQAVIAAKTYVSAYNNADLALDEILEFSNHFYVAVKEKSTGVGAFEILVDRFTGYVQPEPGPNMMWNTKYGQMGGRFGMMGGGARMGGGGMMGRGSMTGGGAMTGRSGIMSGVGGGMNNRWQGNTGPPPTVPMPVTIALARGNAQIYLNQVLPGASLNESTDTFYGYYTIEVIKEGKILGMLSVNGYSGQVWYHTWHGTFVQEKELN